MFDRSTKPQDPSQEKLRMTRWVGNRKILRH